MDQANDPIVELDRSGEVWVGRFRGVGEVRVGPDGAVEVRCDSEDPAAEQALRHGWAELLAFARRGIQLLAGTALVRPGGPAVLLTGDVTTTCDVARSLTDVGWSLISDRPTPVRFDADAITCLPRPAPLLGRPAERTVTGAASTEPDPGPALADGEAAPTTAPRTTRSAPVRPDSNVVALDVPDAGDPAAIAALVEVTVRHVGEDEDVELRGHDRFDHASRLHLAGALRPHRSSDDLAPSPGSPDPDDEHAPDSILISEHLQLAALPVLRLRFDHGDVDGAARRLVEWIELVWDAS